MKTIIRVAKTELRTLFYSPIAWFLLIVFLIQCGVVYLSALELPARAQETGRVIPMLTETIYVSTRGLFPSIMQNLYLYVPLLTMSLISRETSSGTIKLLYSSPVKVREIILGKYLSMVIFSLILLSIIGIFVLSGLFHIQHPDAGMLLSAMLGFFLLLCAYSAIGLFMSCLTTYQVVAAICTFVTIGILSYIGSLWQRIELVRDLTYFLSISGRTQSMLRGLITSKDIIYFLAIIFLFLSFSMFKLKAGMESKPPLVKTGRYVTVIVIVLAIGYISSQPRLTGYYDATSSQLNTITPDVQRIIAGLGEEPLEVTAYVNLLDRMSFLGGPETYNQNLLRWERYVRFKPDMQLKTVLYYDNPLTKPNFFKGYPGKTLKEIAEQYAKSNSLQLKEYLTPEQIKQQINLVPEDNRYVMQLKWKGRTTFLRVFDDQLIWPTEAEVAAALKRLQQAQMPEIAFVTGNMERDINKSGDRDYKVLTNTNQFRNSLVNQGFNVRAVELDNETIPSGIAALVVADPRLELSPVVLQKLETYIANGGNLLIAGEAGKEGILNPLLKKLGVQLMSGMLLQESRDDAPNMLSPYITAAAVPMYKLLERPVADSAQVSMPGAAALSYNATSFHAEPLLVTDARKSWNRVKPVDPEMLMAPARATETKAATDQQADTLRRKKPETISYNAADGDSMSSFTTAVALSRKINNKEQRIVVTGDADFLSNKELERWGKHNFRFSTAVFSWLSNGEFPVNTYRPEAKDNHLNVSIDGVSTLRIIYVWVLPAILLAAAAILLIRRKRK